jgi:hypothetical protein
VVRPIEATIAAPLAIFETLHVPITMVVLKNTAQNERYVSGIFDNRWKKEE